MHFKKLHLTSALAFAFASVLLITGCSKDDVVELVGVCPIVLSTVPEDGDINVPLDQVITVTFNEGVDPETINEQTFTVDGSSSVAGTVTFSGTTASFTPSADLEPNTTYTGVVTTSIKDFLGNALQQNYVWTFTTIPEITLSATPEAGGMLLGAGTFSQGSTVTIAAIPSEGYTFTSWTVDGTVVSTSSSYQFDMDGNMALVANFEEVVLGNFRINLSSSPIAGGTTNGSGQFTENSTVTVSALPNSGYVFVNWTEGETAVSTSSSYQFVLTENRTLVANYSQIPADQFAVILSASPSVGGSVNGSGSFNDETNVTVTATPNTGYAFVNWTANGSEVSTNSSYSFELTANTTLVANFEVSTTYTLNVNAENGSVEINPDQQTYNDGAQVVLTATPAEGYEFSSWSGDASGNNNPLTVTMNSDKDITANFTPIESSFTLNVTAENGTVAKNPNQETYNNGAEVVLTATPIDGYEFSSWSGDASGTNNPLTVTMNSDKDITANFTLIESSFTLNVTAQNGDVDVTPEQQTYNDGDQVVLTAAPIDGYEFSNWSGDASGTNNPLTVTMDSDKDITANFTPIESSFTLNVTAQNGDVDVTPEQQTYNEGDQVVLTATPIDGYEFSSWSVDATGSNNPLTVVMNSNKNITANFTQVNNAGIQGINLRSAGDFAILGGAGVANTGVTTLIRGDVGSFPTPTITGLLEANVIGTLYTTASPVVEQAQLDLTTAFNEAQARSLNAISLPGQLGGQTLAPGLYVNSSTSGISGTGPQGILTLDAGGNPNAVWIFKMGSTLITDAGTSIVLAGGAKAENIFWSVGTSATLGTNSSFYGNILADQAITLTTGATLVGRALTRIAAVTLDSNAVTKP